jgi:hypothetical protein
VTCTDSIAGPFTIGAGQEITLDSVFSLQTGEHLSDGETVTLQILDADSAAALFYEMWAPVDAPVLTFLPDDLRPFQSLFLAMGIYGNLEAEEQHRLASYLREGGNLYLELYPMRWHLMKGSELMKLFRYTTATGPHKKVTGIQGSPEGFASDMMFNLDDDQLYAKYLITPLSPGMRLFHDPASDEVTVARLPEGPLTVTVTDPAGRIMQRRQALPAPPHGSLTIKLPGMVPGIYLMVLKSSNFVFTERLVIR